MSRDVWVLSSLPPCANFEDDPTAVAPGMIACTSSDSGGCPCENEEITSDQSGWVVGVYASYQSALERIDDLTDDPTVAELTTNTSRGEFIEKVFWKVDSETKHPEDGYKRLQIRLYAIEGDEA